jgi:ribosome maturation factor RimP
MVTDEETLRNIEHTLTPILQEDGLELVEIEFRPTGKRWLLRIFIDRPGGVTIADCERVNRELGRTLDVEDFIEHPYTLEVSSPGLTRPLQKKEDFERFRGRLCKVVTRELLTNGKNEFAGEIAGTTETDVEIKGKSDVFTIPICAIKKAHLEYE